MGGGQSTAAAAAGDGPDAAEPPPPQPSYWQMARAGYQELVKAIIRPPRAEYREEPHLGPQEFDFCGRRFLRRDFEVTNERGQRLRCSHWEPQEYPAAAEGGQLPCLVYLHGNSSARLEALSQLSLCLSLGVTVAALDFSGSGLSEGEYVSLGFFEKDDLKALLAELRATGRVSCVALWGRSMGAVTALMHAARDPGIAAMVLDSPFADLAVLADEMVDKGREHGVHVPRFVTRLALRAIRASVQQRAGFSIAELAPVLHAPSCFCPALFVAGQDDDFIAPSHAEAIKAVYGGDSNLLLVDGDHNSMRPRFLYDSVSIFIQQILPLNDEYVLPGASRFVGLPPWVCLVPDGRGGERIVWPEGADGETVEEDERHYWSEAHAYDVGHPVSFVGGSSGGVRPHGVGLNREEGVILEPDADGSSAQLAFGMTQRRQREIHGAVVNMMGGGGGNGGGGGSGSRRSRRRPANGEEAAIAAAAAEWACELCTLINTGRHSCCDACGSARPPVPRSPRNQNAARSSPSPVPAGAGPPILLVPGGGGGGMDGDGGQGEEGEEALLPPVLPGGEEGKEEETEEAKAADPNV